MIWLCVAHLRLRLLATAAYRAIFPFEQFFSRKLYSIRIKMIHSTVHTHTSQRYIRPECELRSYDKSQSTQFRYFTVNIVPAQLANSRLHICYVVIQYRNVYDLHAEEPTHATVLYVRSRSLNIHTQINSFSLAHSSLNPSSHSHFVRCIHYHRQMHD